MKPLRGIILLYMLCQVLSGCLCEALAKQGRAYIIVANFQVSINRAVPSAIRWLAEADGSGFIDNHKQKTTEILLKNG